MAVSFEGTLPNISSFYPLSFSVPILLHKVKSILFRGRWLDASEQSIVTKSFAFGLFFITSGVDKLLQKQLKVFHLFKDAMDHRLIHLEHS